MFTEAHPTQTTHGRTIGDRRRFQRGALTITVRRLRPGAVLVRIRGYDRGLLGTAPLDDVAQEVGANPPVALFVDAAEAEGATWAVSQQWTRWFQDHRERLARVAILVRSKLVRQTVAVARDLSRTGRLIEIYDDADWFAQVMQQEAVGRGGDARRKRLEGARLAERPARPLVRAGLHERPEPMSRHGRVLVAMSGGVDSSVTAALLHGEGYEVVGVTMKTWDYATTGGKAEARARSGKEVGCCSIESMNDARAVAVRLGFPHFVVDIREEFGDGVVERFTTDYLAGRTPNPCVLCNTHIKWAALLRRADALGCDLIATGHYARVRQDEETGRWVVGRGRDRNKDQSYALWGIAQEHLARTRFPLGAYTKPEIRGLAADLGLGHVARKPDSYEICFIPDNDYRGFLSRRVAGLAERVAGGPFVMETTGEQVGAHRGYPFYTVGQRRGLDLGGAVGAGEAVYVTRIDAATNTVFVGTKEALLGRTLTARGLVFGKAADFRDERPALGQIRYKDPGAPCLVRQTAEDEVEVVFDTPRAAITPGQALVLYDGDDVLAGGWIHTVPRAGSPTAVASEATPSDSFIALPTL